MLSIDMYIQCNSCRTDKHSLSVPCYVLSTAFEAPQARHSTRARPSHRIIPLVFFSQNPMGFANRRMWINF